MKKLFGSLILVLFALTNVMIFSTPLFAKDKETCYVSGNIGFAKLSDSDVTNSTISDTTINMEFDNGLALGFAFGYDFGNTRLEWDISHQKNNFEKASLSGYNSVDLTGNVTSLTLLMNGYYDFTNSSAFTPYITGGLGIATIEIKDWNISDSGLSSFNERCTAYAYQVGAGIGYAITEKITIDTKYRYFATEDLKFDGIKTEYANHNFLFGIRINF